MTATEVLRLKAAVRERDGFACTKCGMTADQHRARHGRTLDVHRLTPGSVYTIEGCVTRCIPCHGPEPKRPRFTVDQANPGKVKIRADLAVKLRVIRQLSRQMGKQFIISRYLNALVRRPIKQLHDELTRPARGIRPALRLDFDLSEFHLS